MPRPRPPCRVDTITLPVFGMSWYANPGDGTSLVAYCGGGGSARTGVNNLIFVREPGNDKDFKISTGENVGVALVIYQNPLTKLLWLAVAMGKNVQRYTLFPEDREEEQHHDDDDEGSTENEDEDEDDPNEKNGVGKISGIINVGDGTNALAVNAMTDRLAVGCESGIIKVYEISDEFFGYAWNSGKSLKDNCCDKIDEPLYVLEGHTKMVCSLAFSMRNSRLISSAKDGFAILWQEHSNHEQQQRENENDVSVGIPTGTQLAKLKCLVADSNPKAPKPKRPQQVLVRGCAFGDIEGKLVYTMASAKRGNAYLSRWIQTQAQNDKVKMECELRTAVSAKPVSAMCLSGDAGLMSLGTVDGSIILWGVEKWKPMRTFHNVHEFPVTCIAARPYPLPLQGEDDGVQMHAVSASADSQLAWLTLQKRVPKKKRPSSSHLSGPGLFLSFFTSHYTLFFCLIAYMIVVETKRKCLPGVEDIFAEIIGEEIDFGELQRCVMNEVLIADPTARPGVLSPPY